MYSLAHFWLQQEWIFSKLDVRLKKHFHFPKVKIKDNVEHKILQIKDKNWKDIFKYDFHLQLAIERNPR